MVSNYRETSNRLREDPRYADGANEMDALAVSLKSKGLLPDKIESQPTTELQLEWSRQSSKLAKLFAKELGFETSEKYVATLPKFEPQPEQFGGRFDIPVLVETRIPLKEMLRLAGIVTHVEVDLIKDWQEGKFSTPKTPYTTWLSDGSSNLSKSVDNIRKSLKNDERGGTVLDGIALYLKDPKVLGRHFLDFPGSQVGSFSAPSLFHWFRRPVLHPYFVDDRLPLYGSVVAGKL